MTPSQFYRNYIGLVTLGLLNNIVYVIVISSAQELARSFNSEKQFGNITWATNVTGILCRFFAMALERRSFALRVGITVSFSLAGLLVIAFSDAAGFWLCVIGVVLIGTAGNFGESVMLGYQKLFPPEVVGGWGMGTGLAGVAGSGLYLALTGIRPRWVFLGAVPFAAAYALVYAFVMKRPERPPPHDRESLLSAASGDEDDDAAAAGDAQGQAEEPITVGRVWRIAKQVNWLAVNMGLVYYSEYIVSQGGANNANPDSFSEGNWWQKNAYPLLQFCYQLGVLCSRSSLKFVKIQRVDIVTALQLGNLVLWLLQDKYRFLPLYSQFPLMVCVGLLGGLSYVNIFYLILKDAKFQNKDREIAVNISAAYMNVGIIMAGVTVVIFDNLGLFAKK
jgi:battenin